MLRSGANEIDELVRRLGSRHRTRVDAARARLAVIGGRAVEALIHALEDDRNLVRERAMSLLSLIQDPRAREPLAAMLLDRSPRLRRLAARCLGRFPSAEAGTALRRLLEREQRPEVRAGAVEALVQQVAAGRDEAVSTALEVLTRPDEPAAVRIAAMALLPHLPAAQRRGLLDRLRRDPVDDVRGHAEDLVSATPETRTTGADLERWFDELASQDYARWNAGVQHLAAMGGAAVDPLLDAMQARAHDPEYCTRAGMALRAMGPRRARALADALERIDEPLPLQVLVEVIGALGEKAAIYRLKELIDRLAARPLPATEANGTDLMQRVRAKAHLELARIGSRVAIQDLRAGLNDPERRVELEMLAAVELVGKREEIGTLLFVHAREDAFTQERIARVVRAIMKRERIRRSNRLFQGFTAAQREALETILPAPVPRPRRRRRPDALLP